MSSRIGGLWRSHPEFDKKEISSFWDPQLYFWVSNFWWYSNLQYCHDLEHVLKWVPGPDLLLDVEISLQNSQILLNMSFKSKKYVQKNIFTLKNDPESISSISRITPESFRSNVHIIFSLPDPKNLDFQLKSDKKFKVRPQYTRLTCSKCSIRTAPHANCARLDTSSRRSHGVPVMIEF